MENTLEKLVDTKMTTARVRRENPFLVVCLGMGRDSVAMLIWLYLLGIVPQIIAFADLGAERNSTYEYIPILNAWLKKVGFPEISIVKARRTRDNSFEHHLFRLGVFPSLTYNQHKCAVAWKIEVIQEYLENRADYQDAVRAGRTVVKCVGFEAGEEYRADRKKKKDAENCAEAGAFKLPDGELAWYPLIEHGLDLDKCVALIEREIGFVPSKSSCYFCAAMRKPEIVSLHELEPHKFFKGLVLERLVQTNKVVPPRGRDGIAYGKKWSDMPFAKQYEAAVGKAIELFRLERTLADGLRHSDKWKPKTERVKIFLDFCNDSELFRKFLETLEIPVEVQSQIEKNTVGELALDE